MNEHIRFQAKLAGAQLGEEGEGGNGAGQSGNVPVTGDIAGVDGITIQRA